MAWVVDTSVLFDILFDDPRFAENSVLCLTRHAAGGLIIPAVIFVELAPAFSGDAAEANAFLRSKDIDCSMEWSDADTRMAFDLWAKYTARRRSSQLPRRPVADVLIAAFATRHQGVITRNAADFRAVAPTLTVIDAAIPLSSQP